MISRIEIEHPQQCEMATWQVVDHQHPADIHPLPA
jgi:hypothetical protein